MSPIRPVLGVPSGLTQALVVPARERVYEKPPSARRFCSTKKVEMASRRYFDVSKPLSDVSGSSIPDDLDRSIAFEASGTDEKCVLDGFGEFCSQQTTPLAGWLPLDAIARIKNGLCVGAEALGRHVSKLRLRAAGMISHTFFRFVLKLSPIELFRASNRADLFWQNKCTIRRYDDACNTVLNRQPNETIPYKFLPHALDSVKQVVSTEEKRMSTHKKAQSLLVEDDKLTHRADPPYEPTLEEIRARAYEAYIQRGRIDGLDLEDWLQAERELRENGHKRVDS